MAIEMCANSKALHAAFALFNFVYRINLYTLLDGRKNPQIHRCWRNCAKTNQRTDDLKKFTRLVMEMLAEQTT